MSYFSRLRQQSELRVTAHTVHAVGALPSTVQDTADAFEITDVVEALPGDPIRATRRSPELATAPAETREPVPQSVPPPDPTAEGERVAVHDASSEASSAPPISARPSSQRAANAIETFDSEPVSAEVALREVFRWIARAPQSADRDVRPVAPRHPEGVSPTASVPGPADRPVARPPIRSRAAVTAAPAVREREAASVEGDLVEHVDAPPELKMRRTVSTPYAIERRDAPADVDETLTVSIGAIHVRVDAPAPPPVPVRRPASSRPARPARNTGSRLARHYLRT